MKKHKIFLLLVVGSFTLSAQDEIKNISRKACDCISELDVTDSNKKDMTTKLGVCFISASAGHEKFLKDKHGIDLTGKKLKKSGKKLGELIAMQAIIDCPMLIMAMVSGEGYTAAQVEYKKSRTKVTAPVVKTIPVKSVTGKVIKVEKEGFASFSVLGTDGFTSKLYWIDFFENSSVLLEDATKLKAKQFLFTYIEKKVFFAAKNNYELVKVLTGVSIAK